MTSDMIGFSLGITRENILREAMYLLCQELQLTAPTYSLPFQEKNAVWDLFFQEFVSRFHPDRLQYSYNTESRRVEAITKLSQTIRKTYTSQELDSLIPEELGTFLYDLLQSLVKTTYFCPQSSRNEIVSFRVTPEDIWKYMPESLFPQIPYAFFFLFSRSYIGVHVRFQDLARGGLRTIFLDDSHARAREEKQVFTECYQLAFTQNKKNKDIAEGGSKGVLFARVHIEPALVEETLFSMQKLYVQELVSLVNVDESLGKLRDSMVVDYFRLPEYIYLGPDERMKGYAIEWISQYAYEQQYRPGLVFMTSKPKAGINHKAYGVTSQGLMSWLRYSMKELLQVDITSIPFRITMTGGPDGDVASNMIKIIAEQCPSTGQFLAIKDKSGMAFDPQGLHLSELALLASQEKPISFYSPTLLSPLGWLLVRDEQGGNGGGDHASYHIYTHPESEMKKEFQHASQIHCMQMYNEGIYQIPSDVFLPAGGRPASLSKDNVAICVCSDTQSPYFPFVLEGANLFLTKDARSILEERGVFIVKDSSANKGGVISSSYEVFCGLILSEEEFLYHKDMLAHQIIDRIQASCLLEAKCLIGSWKAVSSIDQAKKTSNLVETSLIISDTILSLKQRIQVLLSHWDPRDGYKEGKGDVFRDCLFEYALPLLREKYQSRLVFGLPIPHQRACVAAFIASHYVYMNAVFQNGSNHMLGDSKSLDFQTLSGIAASLLHTFSDLADQSL